MREDASQPAAVSLFAPPQRRPISRDGIVTSSSAAVLHTYLYPPSQFNFAPTSRFRGSDMYERCAIPRTDLNNEAVTSITEISDPSICFKVVCVQNFCMSNFRPYSPGERVAHCPARCGGLQPPTLYSLVWSI